MALTLDLFVRKRLTYQDLNGKIQIPIQNYINQKCVIQDDVSADIAANKIVRRDANGRAKVAAPVEDDDIARLDTVGAAIKTHTHTRSQITDFPTAMPADGGDADTVDGVHAKIMIPSTNILLSATTERRTPWGSTERVILKHFKLGYPGICNLSYQYRGAGGAPAIKFTAELWISNKKYQTIGSIEASGAMYLTYEAEVITPFPAAEIVIWGQALQDQYGDINQGRIRNAYVKGSLIQIDPSFQVVVD